jgi:D-alanyl-D-alanine dipeptidase
LKEEVLDQVMQSVKKVDEVIAHELEDKGIPSISYALVDRNDTLASGHLMRQGLNTTVDDASTFRVGSCSKMFTTLSLMQLVEQGLVDIDKDVSTYIPGFEPHNPFAEPGEPSDRASITLRKLMSHTAGIVREPAVGHCLDDTPVTLKTMAERLGRSTLKEDPSAGVFRYSNAGMNVVGHAVERLSGKAFPQYVQESIIDPIGMRHSSFVQTPYILEHLAPANMWSFEGDFPAPVFDMGGWAAGNLFSTIPDMAKFIQTLLRGGYSRNARPIVSPATLHSMWVPIGFQGNAGYGLGFQTGTLDGWEAVGHNGAVYGYATHVTILPEAGLGIVLCATLDNVKNLPARMAMYALRLALAALGMGREPEAQLPYAMLTAEQTEALSGFYRSGQEIVEVIVKDEKLYLMGDGVPLRIQPRSELQFVVDGRLFGPGSAYPHLDVTFSRSAARTRGAAGLT